MPTVEQVLDKAEKTIGKSKNVDLWRPSDARVNAEELLAKVLGREITAEDLEDEVSAKSARSFERLVARRAGGEPVALIVGHIDFCGLKMRTRKGIFVPRNSSELMAELAASRLRRRRAPIAVDVACGAGPVAMAIAAKVSGARVIGLDIWKPSLRLARQNAAELGLAVDFLCSDMLVALPAEVRGKVDVFTIHPPYVAKSDLKTLPREIRDYEPAVSLSDNSHDGLDLVRRLAGDAPGWLRAGGWVLVEISPDLSRRVSGILRKAGFKQVKSNRDSLGATRVVAGRI